MQFTFDLGVLGFTTQTNLFSVFFFYIPDAHNHVVNRQQPYLVQSYEPSSFKNHTMSMTTSPQAMHHK